MHPGHVRYYQQMFWPSGDLARLVRMGFLPDGEAAECWEQWKQHRDLDGVTWEEHKVFARLAPRLAAIAPDCPYRPRLEGLVKSHWTRSQLMLHASAKAIDVLAARGIPVMLLKGGALQMDRARQHGPRITSDLDVLVPRDRFADAVDALYTAGWRSNRSVEFLKIQWRFGPGLNLRFPPHGDVDVHHQPVHGPQLPAAVLDALWQRSREDVFLGRPVRIPTVEDMLVFTAAHAAHPELSRQAGAAWVFDLAALLDHPDLSVPQVVDRAREFSASPALMVTLEYWYRLTGSARARELMMALQHRGLPWSEQWQFFLQTPVIRPRKWRRRWQQLRRWSGMEYEFAAVPHLGQVNFPDAVSAGIPRQVAHDLPCTRQELSVPPPPSGAAALVLELAFDPPRVRRYTFEISADGEALAVFTSSASRIRGATDFHASVRIPLSLAGSSGRHWRMLAIESVNLKAVLPANPTLQQQRDAAPPAFRLCRAGWV